MSAYKTSEKILLISVISVALERILFLELHFGKIYSSQVYSYREINDGTAVLLSAMETV